MKVLEREYNETAKIACCEVVTLMTRFNKYCRVLREIEVLLKQNDTISDKSRSAILEERQAIRNILEAIPDRYWEYPIAGRLLSANRRFMVRELSRYLPFLDD